MNDIAQHGSVFSNNAQTTTVYMQQVCDKN